jgi:hypothetical protein
VRRSGWHDVVAGCVLVVLMLKSWAHDDRLDEMRKALDTVTVAPVRS